MDQKEVMKAILNVRNYTKKLKQHASRSIQQIPGNASQQHSILSMSIPTATLARSNTHNPRTASKPNKQRDQNSFNTMIKIHQGRPYQSDRQTEIDHKSATRIYPQPPITTHAIYQNNLEAEDNEYKNSHQAPKSIEWIEILEKKIVEYQKALLFLKREYKEVKDKAEKVPYLQLTIQLLEKQRVEQREVNNQLTSNIITLQQSHLRHIRQLQEHYRTVLQRIQPMLYQMRSIEQENANLRKLLQLKQGTYPQQHSESRSPLQRSFNLEEQSREEQDHIFKNFIHYMNELNSKQIVNEGQVSVEPFQHP